MTEPGTAPEARSARKCLKRGSAEGAMRGSHLMNSQRRLQILLVALLLAIAFRLFANSPAATPLGILAPDLYGKHKLAQKLIDEKRYDEAEQICLAVLKSDPRFFRSEIDLGNIYAYRGDYVKAEKVYRTALDHVGDNLHNRAVLCYNLGGMYERERIPDKSWDYFRRAYALREHLFGDVTFWPEDPKFVAYYVAHNDREGFDVWMRKEKGLLPEEVYRRSKQLEKNMEEGQHLEALGDSNRYLQANPGSMYTTLFQEYKAFALVSLKEWSMAEEVLSELTRTTLPDENRAWALHLLGYALIANGRPNEGIQRLYEITQKYPNYSRLDEVRALALMAYGQKFEAAADQLLKTLLKSSTREI